MALSFSTVKTVLLILLLGFAAACKDHKVTHHASVLSGKKTAPVKEPQVVFPLWVQEKSTMKVTWYIGKPAQLTLLNQKGGVIFTGKMVGKGSYGTAYGNGKWVVKVAHEAADDYGEIRDYKLQKEILKDMAVDFAVTDSESEGVARRLIVMKQYQSNLADFMQGKEKLPKSTLQNLSKQMEVNLRRIFELLELHRDSLPDKHLWDIRGSNILVGEDAAGGLKLKVSDSMHYRLKNRGETENMYRSFLIEHERFGTTQNFIRNLNIASVANWSDLWAENKMAELFLINMLHLDSRKYLVDFDPVYGFKADPSAVGCKSK